MPKKTETKVPPCPYCSDSTLLDAPKGEPGDETYPVPNSGGRFWRKSGPPSLLHAFNYGKRWVADVPPEYFSASLADFTARSVGVEIGFFLPEGMSPPPPFSNHISTHLRQRRPLVPAPHVGAAPTVAYILFSGCVVQHESGVEVRAHWWPSHGWIINQRVKLTASDPSERNAQLERAHTALNFFLLETRGAAKITRNALFRTLDKLGAEATQAAVAAKIGVTPNALHLYVKRTYGGWEKAKEQYTSERMSPI